MTKEFNLSEKENSGRAYARKHIKEFIARLRHEGQRRCWGYFDDVIDKLAGSKLI